MLPPPVLMAIAPLVKGYHWFGVPWLFTTTEPVVALTIDDAFGQDGGAEELAALLAQFPDHKVTFFVTGANNVDAATVDLFPGHEFQHHQMHDKNYLNVPMEEFVADFQATEAKIMEHSPKPRFYRGPELDISAEQLGYVMSKGYTPIAGLLFAGEWLNGRFPLSQVVGTLAHYAHAGSVIILHWPNPGCTGPDRSHEIAQIGAMLTQLSTKGLTSVGISDARLGVPTVPSLTANFGEIMSMMGAMGMDLDTLMAMIGR